METLEDRCVLSTSIPIGSSSWVSVGPTPLLNGASGGAPSSGRIAALAAHPTDPNTIYIAAAGGGVWKTTDGGLNWTPKTDTQKTLFMGAIAIAPSNPSVIYAGTGEANNSEDSYYGRGVLKSTDAGNTWTLLDGDVAGNSSANSFDRRSIAKIVVDPLDSNRVYVAVSGAGTNGLGGSRGIWRSLDGGATWVNTTSSITSSLSFTDLVIDPRKNGDSAVLYAAIGTIGGSATNGVYKSVDGGANWALAGNFPTSSSNGRISIAIAKSAPDTLYASIHDAVDDGVLSIQKTTDGGATWTATTTPPNYMEDQGWYDQTIAIDPAQPSRVFLGGASGATGFLESTNGGSSWIAIGTGANGTGPHADHHAIGFDASGRLLDGNDGGLWRLDNPTIGSIMWANLNGTAANPALGTIQFTGIALDPINANIAYGGSQDNGTEKFNNSVGWTHVVGGDGGFVRVDPSNPTTVYHTFQQEGDGGTAGSGFLERSDNAGASWTSKTSGIGANDPVNFYIPYVINPTNSNRLVLGTNRIYETVNRGDSWKAISTVGVNGWNASGDVVDCLAIRGNTIYAAAGGRIYVSTDDGANWNERDPFSPAATLQYRDILIDPTDANIAYVVVGSFTNIANTRHVFRTVNAGGSWSDISVNLPDLPTWSLELDPRGAGSSDDVIYVGTDDGVYASRDLGITWSRFGSGLPNAQVVDLDRAPGLGLLAAGTHGRGMWEILLASTVVTLAGGTLTIADTDPQGIDNKFSLTRTNAGTYQLSDASGAGIDVSSIAGATGSGTASVTIPASGVTSVVVNGAAGVDTLTVNLSSGSVLPSGGVTFNGGNPSPLAGERLTLTGGSQGTVNFNYANAHDGSVVMSNFGTVSYSSLDSISDNGAATDIFFNLAQAAPNAVTLGDDGASGNLLSRLSGATFETTDFANPTGTLTISRGNVADTLTINALPDFNAGLTGGSLGNPFSAITLAGSATLAAGKSLAASAVTVNVTPAGAAAVSGGGTVNLTTDNVNIDAGGSISAGMGTVSISQLAAGRLIDLGTETIGQLSLTDSKLDGITAGTLNIGDANSGPITISADITRSAATFINLTSGGAINFVGGLLDTGGGNSTLSPGSAAGVGLVKVGNDVNLGASGTLSFTNGSDVGVAISSATSNTQLNVIGKVNLTGTDLVLSGSYVPALTDRFVVVDNDGADPILGTFTNLPEGKLVNINGLNAVITYVGGTGNDVVLDIEEAPVLDVTKSPLLATVDEDSGGPSGAVGTLISSLVDFSTSVGGIDNVTDPDSGALLGIGLTAVDPSLSCYYSLNGGTDWAAVGAVSNGSSRLLAADSDNRIYCQAGLNVNGTFGSAMTFRAWDQTTGIDGALADTTTNGGTTAFSAASDGIGFTINAVNNAPTRKGATVVLAAIAEDTAAPPGSSVSSLFGSVFSDVDATTIDAGGVAIIANAAKATEGTWQVLVAGGAFTDLPIIADSTAVVLLGAGDRIRFLPAANFSGTPGALTVRLWDGSGGFAAATSVQNITASIGAMGGFSDNSNEVTLNTSVTPVNDTPTRTAAAANLAAIAEDTQDPLGDSVSDLFGNVFFDADATTIATGGAAIVANAATASQGTWQIRTAAGAFTDLPPLVDSTSAMVLAAGDSIRFLPAHDFNGAPGSLTVRLWDGTGGFVAQAAVQDISGGLVGGGSFSDDANKVTLGTSITAVNDPPSFKHQAGDISASDEDPVLHSPAPIKSISGWATEISTGPSDESKQTRFFHVQNDNPSLFTISPIVTSTGLLSFQPAPNKHGTATVSVYLQDNGDGTNTSPVVTFHIEIIKTHPLHNAADPPARNGFDVTGSTSLQPDGSIVSNDVLAVINFINSRRSPADAGYGPPYVDVTADGKVAPDDVVAVVNWINAHPGKSEAEDAQAADVVEASSATSSVAMPDAETADLISLLAYDAADAQTRRRRI